MANPATTPWLFRNRQFLIGIVFFLTYLSGRLLGDAPPWDRLDGVLSLPAPYLLGSPTTAVPPTNVAPLAIPLALSLLAFLCRWWGTSYLRGHVMADRHMHSDRLIIAGPFRFVRNPLYLGNILLMAGFALFFAPPALLIGVLGMSLVGALLARVEARGLQRQHGPDYAAYARRVPAFLPTPRPAPATATVDAAWLDGFTAELWSLLMVPYLALIALHAYTAALVVGIVLAAGLLWRAIHNRAARRRTPANGD